MTIKYYKLKINQNYYEVKKKSNQQTRQNGEQRENGNQQADGEIRRAFLNQLENGVENRLEGENLRENQPVVRLKLARLQMQRLIRDALLESQQYQAHVSTHLLSERNYVTTEHNRDNQTEVNRFQNKQSSLGVPVHVVNVPHY